MEEFLGRRDDEQAWTGAGPGRFAVGGKYAAISCGLLFRLHTSLSLGCVFNPCGT